MAMHMKKIRFPGGLDKAFTMSYDDGVEQDIRLIEIMRKNGVKGTFNIGAGCFPPEDIVYPKGQIHRRMPASVCVKAFEGSDIEVAVHGHTHPFLESLPTATAMMEIIRDRAELEELYGEMICGMAYPYGTYSDQVVDILRLAGIKYARTVESRMDFKIPSDWLRMGATCHHNNPQLTALLDKFLTEKVSERQDGFLFYLWGHSYEFEGNDNWHVIENFLEKMGNRPDVWYATNIEIYDYVKAYEALEFSINGKIAKNPTGTDVWASINNKVVYFPAGKTIEI